MTDRIALKDLLEFTRDGEWGKSEPTSAHVEMAVIRGTDFASVRSGDISSVPRRFIPSKAAERKELQPGDVLIETAGGTKDQPTGRTVFLNERLFETSDIPITCASFSRFLRVKRDLIDPRYLFWYLQSIYTTGEMLPYHIQHTGVARFQYTDFASQWLVPIPSMDRQVEIADALSTIDDKIELNRRMNETLEAMAQAVFRDWFVNFGPTRRKLEGATDPVANLGGLTTNSDKAGALTDLFPATFAANGLPDGWEFCPADQLVEFNPSEPLKKGILAPYTDMASLPTAGSSAKPPIMREFGSGMRFRNSDSLLARITPCLENGKAAFVDFLPEKHPVGWGSTEFFVLRSRPPVPSQYSYCLIRNPDFKQAAVKSMTGTSGRQRAQIDMLRGYSLACANDDTFIAFGEIIEPFFQTVSHNNKQSETLASIRNLLLPKLISGEIRLSDAEAVA